MAPHPDMLAQNVTKTRHHEVYPEIATCNHKGRNVLITGASRGIGRATAISFAKAGAATIIIGARSGLDEVEADILKAAPKGSSPTVIKLKLDVTREEDVSNAAKLVADKIDKLDVLVNNAGYLEDWKKVTESDPKDWWVSYEINVKGTYLMSRAFIPLLTKGQGYILNLSSTGALALIPGASSYQTNKFAVLKFTEFLNVEYGEQGILAVVFHPGGVATPLGLNMPELMHSWLVDPPELAANTFTWFTQERREWLAGRYIDVTWDMPELLAQKDAIVADDKLKMRIVL